MQQQQSIGHFRLECGGVVCDERHIVEVAGGRTMSAVDRTDIQRMALRHGIVSPHPVRQFLLGSALVALAYFPTAHLVHWALHGGSILSQEVWCIPFAFIGFWIVATAMRCGWFLEIESTKRRKHIAFARTADLASIEDFIAQVQRAYGTQIEREVVPPA